MEHLALAESLLTKFIELVNTPLDVERFALARHQREWSTSSQFYFGKNEDIVLNYDEESPMDANIRRALGHHSVNPNDKKRSFLLTNSYVQCKDPKYSDCINISNESEENFLKTIMTRALRDHIQDESHEREACLRDRFLLVGERGVGKTYFLNYFFTKYADVLNTNRIIWVRLDLVDVGKKMANQSGDVPAGFNIRSALVAQLAKILIRYYDPCSNEAIEWKGQKGIPELDFMGHIHDTLKQRGNWDFTEVESRLKFLYLKAARYYGTKSERETDPHPTDVVEDDLIREIPAFLAAQKWSVVYVLDGLDILDATPEAHNIFHTIQSSIKKEFGGKDVLRGCLLIVQRENTRLLMESLGSGSTYTGGTSLKAYKIGRPAPEASLLQRLNAIIEYARLQEWKVQDVEYKLEKFLKFLHIELNGRESSSKDKDFRSQMGDFDWDYIDSLFSLNHRAMHYGLMLAFYEAMKRSPQNHGFVDTLMRSGYGVPLQRYNHSCKDGVFHATARHRLFEEHFMPSVFTFPYSEAPGEILPTRHHGCLVLIILSYLNVLDKTSHKRGGSTIPVATLVGFLNFVLDVESEIIRTCLKEQYEIGTIGLTPGGPEIDDWLAYISCKGRLLVDQELSRVDYLYSAMQLLPLPKKMFFMDKSEQATLVSSSPVSEIFPLKVRRRLGLLDSTEATPRVVSKIINSAMALRLIRFWEKHIKCKTEAIRGSAEIIGYHGEYIALEEMVGTYAYAEITCKRVAEQISIILKGQQSEMLNRIRTTLDLVLAQEKKFFEQALHEGSHPRPQCN